MYLGVLRHHNHLWWGEGLGLPEVWPRIWGPWLPNTSSILQEHLLRGPKGSWEAKTRKLPPRAASGEADF